MSSLTQGLAHRCGADWTSRFDDGQRRALTATARTAFVDTAACVLAGRAEEATRIVAGWAMNRADNNGGHRNAWLRTLDRLGLGFDS